MPRLSCVDPEKAPGEIRTVYEELKKTKWRIPTMYQVLAHNPRVLKAHEAYFDAVMNKGELERKLKEKIAYKVAKLNGCAYSAASHFRYALKTGATEEEMEAVDAMRQDAMTSQESIALRLAEAMAESGKKVTSEMFDELKKSFSPQEIVELLATVGLIVFASRLADALALEPD